MEASTGAPAALPTRNSLDPLSEQIKQKLFKKGISPTPKIIHTLRKKHLHKTLRKSKRLSSQTPQPLTQSQIQTLTHESYFNTIFQEYKQFNKAIDAKMVGKPWESLDKEKVKELGCGFERKVDNFSGKLDFRELKELGLIFEERKIDSLSSFLDDDVELEEGMLEDGDTNGSFMPRRRVSDVDAIKILVERLSAREITMKDWKFTRMMKQSRLQFTEFQLLKIVGGLGDRGCSRQAMEVVRWVYNRNEHRHYKSRFVYTKLLAVLGKARQPKEALCIFEQMRGDCHIYPDMAAYHSIAVTLGQAGMVRELMRIIECLKEKPSKPIKNMKSRNRDPTLQPDIVVFNSVLNACVSSHQWKGVSWVFDQLRKSGLKPNSATYGLAMEVMLHVSKYDQVHELFEKMSRSGMSPNSNTYKVLVRTFWKESKVDDAVNIVRDMERRGIKGMPSVYYELACCLCNKGRWQDAMTEIKKLKKLRLTKPLAVTFTGMILSSMDGGYINDCKSIFEHMLEHCAPNIGAVNAMLKVYGRSDMFLEVKDLFEKVKDKCTGFLGDDDTPLVPDVYTYEAVLEASAHANQWEYFEYVYKEMCFSGCQLDQGKHAMLLVEASKAGKWHLLEHAFETTLEAGEIPHPTLFTEMICQAILQDDYGKAVNLVSSIAHAPFVLNEKDWRGVFEKNKDRINNEHLKILSSTLYGSNIPSESTVSELLKVLDSICGSTPNESLRNQELLDDDFEEDSNTMGSADEFKPFSSTFDSDDDDRASLCSKISSFVDVASDESGYSSEEFVHGIMHTRDDFDELSETDEPGLPSADEILQSWKKI